jgi:transposase
VISTRDIGALRWSGRWRDCSHGGWHPTLTKAWVDTGFKAQAVEHGAALGVDVEIVTKDPQVKGFSMVKRRSIVERTPGWLMQHRRLVRDYEARPGNSEA